MDLPQLPRSQAVDWGAAVDIISYPKTCGFHPSTCFDFSWTCAFGTKNPQHPIPASHLLRAVDKSEIPLKLLVLRTLRMLRASLRAEKHVQGAAAHEPVGQVVAGGWL